MVKIALAGGSGGLGWTIAEALRNSDHEFIILTRAVSSMPWYSYISPVVGPLPDPLW